MNFFTIYNVVVVVKIESNHDADEAEAEEANTIILYLLSGLTCCNPAGSLSLHYFNIKFPLAHTHWTVNKSFYF